MFFLTRHHKKRNRSSQSDRSADSAPATFSSFALGVPSSSSSWSSLLLLPPTSYPASSDGRWFRWLIRPTIDNARRLLLSCIERGDAIVSRMALAAHQGSGDTAFTSVAVASATGNPLLGRSVGRSLGRCFANATFSASKI